MYSLLLKIVMLLMLKGPFGNETPLLLLFGLMVHNLTAASEFIIDQGSLLSGMVPGEIWGLSHNGCPCFWSLLSQSITVVSSLSMDCLNQKLTWFYFWFLCIWGSNCISHPFHSNTQNYGNLQYN